MTIQLREIEIPTGRWHPWWIFTLSLIVSVGWWVPAAQATPIIFGDIEDIVSVDATDCPTCTAHELDVLQRGVGMMLTEMRRAAIGDSGSMGPVCTVEASFARDLSLVTFEAYRSGAISEMRWRDSLRAKAKVAGSLTDPTIEAMLQDYRARLEERFGIWIEPGSLMELQIDIYASTRYAELFEFFANGIWENIIAEIGRPVTGPNPVVEKVANQLWPSRSIWDRLLVYGRPYALWKENELALMRELKDDFEVGTVPEAADILYEDYYLAMSAEPWGVMGFGCGLAAAEGFRRYARELSEGFQVIFLPGHGGDEPPIITDVWPDEPHTAPPPIVDIYPGIPVKLSMIFVEEPWPNLVIERRGRPAYDDPGLPVLRPRQHTGIDPSGGGNPNGGDPNGSGPSWGNPPLGPDGPDEGTLPWGLWNATPEDYRQYALRQICGNQCPGAIAGITLPPIHDWGMGEGQIDSPNPSPICLCQP